LSENKPKKKIIFTIYFVLPLFIYAAIIIFISSLENISIPSIGLRLEDKIVHFLEYFIFGFLLLRALHFGSSSPVTIKLFLLSIAIGVFFGITDEFHQYFVPGRYFDLLDWLADSIGVTVGGEFYRRLHWFEMQVFNFTLKR
jgi:hypothetical protein